MVDPATAEKLNCAKVLERSGDLLVLGPDTPAEIPGNIQYALRTLLPARKTPLTLRVRWPEDHDNAPAGFQYPENENFSAVLCKALFVSEDGKTWRRLENAKARERGAEVQIPPANGPLHFSVGVPYSPWDLSDLETYLADHPRWETRDLGTSAGGHFLKGFVRSARDASKGTFYLQAYQHYSEWAGPIALDSLARNLDALPGADAFTWALAPCVNADALAGGWKRDRMYNGSAAHLPCGGNFNRDWGPFLHPETKAFAGFFEEIHRASPVIHALDFHMGWSSSRNSGGGITVFQDNQVDARREKELLDFSDHYFRHVPIEPFPWKNTVVERPTFAAWVVREFGVPAQTVEVSRFEGRDPNGNRFPATQSYYQSIGPATAGALTGWHKN